MQYETLLVQIEDGIGTITLNRPKVLNALNNKVFDELARAALELDMNEEVRAVIITGGDKAFAAGADIDQYAQENAVFFVTYQTAHRAYHLIESMPKPVIAAVAGYALGGGCELTMVADVRIAAENAMFGLPEIKLGILPGIGGTQRLPRLIGAGRAKEMIFGGEPIAAKEAWRIGLVNKVVPNEQLFDEARKMAKSFANKGAVALRLAKSCINEGMQMDLDSGLKYENKCYSILFSTEDQKEGFRAFQEKRKPNFKGR